MITYNNQTTYHLELTWGKSLFALNQVGNKTIGGTYPYVWIITLCGLANSNRLYTCTEIAEAIVEVNRIISININDINHINHIISFCGKDEIVIDLNIHDTSSVIHIILQNG